MARPSRTAASSRAIFRTPRDGGDRGDPPRRRRARPRARPISASAASTIRTDHRTPALGLRRQGLGILHAAACATSTRGADHGRPALPTPAASRRLGRGQRRLLLHPRSTHNHRPSKSSTTRSAPTPATTAGLRGDGSRLLHECRRHAHQRMDHDRASTTTRRPNTACSRADDPVAEPKLVAARETGLQYDLEEGGDVFFILTNADGAKDFKIMTAPVSRPARAQLARAGAARAGPADPVDPRLQGLPGPARAQGRPAAHRRARPRDRRGARRSPSTRRPISLGLSGSYEYDTDIDALLLFVDDDAGAALRLRHAHPRAHAAEDAGSAVRPRSGRTTSRAA